MTPPRTPPTPQYWCYDLGGGWQAWAGKTAEDNDLLSLTCAKQDELWFHANAVPGSHVILKAPEGADAPSRDLIHTTAAIAAYHSKARTAGVTTVCYTQAKFVGKERGAKPGSVVIRRETIIKVRPALPTPQPPQA